MYAPHKMCLQCVTYEHRSNLVWPDRAEQLFEIRNILIKNRFDRLPDRMARTNEFVIIGSS